MKGKDIAVIGGLAIGGYYLYQVLKGQSSTTTSGGTTGSGGVSLDLGGLISGLSLGGGSSGGDSGGGGITKTLTDLVGKLVEAPKAVVDAGGSASGLDDIVKKLTDAFSGVNTVKTFFDDATKTIKTTAETAKTDISKAVDTANNIISEIPTAAKSVGSNSEFDLHNWFSQHINPFNNENADAVSKLKETGPVVATYKWGWSWLPDSLETWMGSIAYGNRVATDKYGLFGLSDKTQYSPAVESAISNPYNTSDPYVKNLSKVSAAERTNAAVQKEGPPPGQADLGGSWQQSWGKGYSYYIPGF
jgi:hypothetical protein